MKDFREFLLNLMLEINFFCLNQELKQKLLLLNILRPIIFNLKAIISYLFILLYLCILLLISSYFVKQ
jgi:hypothetical protein